MTRISKVDPNEGGTRARDTKTFLMLSGVNHNLFGSRDPTQYGSFTLAQIEEQLTNVGNELGVNVICAQTNYEGEMCELVSWLRRRLDVRAGSGWRELGRADIPLAERGDCRSTMLG